VIGSDLEGGSGKPGGMYQQMPEQSGGVCSGIWLVLH
jgi:hypothetical protein